jgi:hypothetical protein
MARPRFVQNCTVIQLERKINPVSGKKVQNKTSVIFQNGDRRIVAAYTLWKIPGAQQPGLGARGFVK